MNEVLIIILLVIILLASMLFIPQWRLKRAIPQVVRIFREMNALDMKNAKTIDELGLRPKGMMEQMFKRRDYKQYALTVLMQTGIIQTTEDGKLYLSEEMLSESRFAVPTSYYR